MGLLEIEASLILRIYTIGLQLAFKIDKSNEKNPGTQ